MNYSVCFIFNLMECGIGACLGATIPLSCSAADGFRNIQRLCQLTPSNSSQDHPSCNTSFLLPHYPKIFIFVYLVDTKKLVKIAM